MFARVLRSTISQSAAASKLAFPKKSLATVTASRFPLASTHSILLSQQKKTFDISKRNYTSTQAASAPPQVRTKAVHDELRSPDNLFEQDRIANNPDRRAFTYLVLGSSKFVLASAVRVFLLQVVAYVNVTADIRAMSQVEVDIGGVEVGRQMIIKWRGKPIFIRHRTPEEIDTANKTEMSQLKDPQPDAARVKDANYIIIIGICTHLGCVPQGPEGRYNGWYCPCHGSHYDVSGRIREGPAPSNMEIPPYVLNGTKLIVG